MNAIRRAFFTFFINAFSSILGKKAMSEREEIFLLGAMYWQHLLFPSATMEAAASVVLKRLGMENEDPVRWGKQLQGMISKTAKSEEIR